MPIISKAKKDKISEQILHYLFTFSPEARFTTDIAKEIARDEEFTKSLLEDLKNKNLVLEVVKNESGLDYLRRRRWRLTHQVYQIIQQKQSQNHNNIYNSKTIED